MHHLYIASALLGINMYIVGHESEKLHYQNERL